MTWKDILGPALGFLGVLIATFVAFAQRRFEAQLRREVERDIKNHEATLKLQVDTQVQKARGEVERELKSHEVRLRIAAEFRLKMLERMLADVADFRTKLGASFGATYMFVQEVEPNGGGTERARELLKIAQQAFSALSGAGPFMPPALRLGASEISNQFQSCLRDVVEWSSLPTRDERTPRFRETAEQMQALGAQSQKLFSDWQKESYDSFTQMLDRLGEPSKQENTALPPGHS